MRSKTLVTLQARALSFLPGVALKWDI